MILRKIAIIAGEHSGDLLAGGLVRELNSRCSQPIALIGVGGPALQAQGLKSLFDYSELSLMGFTAVISQLPKLIWRINQTARAIIEAKPDCLIIVDSPDFTHRVARKVKRALPDLLIINYVCPSVWAWKPQRARAMRAYIDHVLSILPFEPEVVAKLDGPPLTYVGHRLMNDPGIAAARKAQLDRRAPSGQIAGKPVCLLLPGSRRGEITRLSSDMGKSASQLAELLGDVHFVLPVATGREQMVREAISGWDIDVELVIGEDAKWNAFGRADVAIAASGTVLLELSLAGVPSISLYRLDFIASFLMRLVFTWSGSLPNLIADRIVIQEYYQNEIRPARIARLARQLIVDPLTRRAVLADHDRVYHCMEVEHPPEENAADVVLNLLSDIPKNSE